MENLSKSDHQRGRVPRMVGPSQVSRHRPTISFRTTQITIVRGGGDHVNAFAVSSERFPLRLHRHALMPHSGMSCRAVMSPSPHDRFIFSSSTFSSIRNHLGSSPFWNFLIGKERERRAHTHPTLSADSGPSPT